jgi:hypothetical protein
MSLMKIPPILLWAAEQRTALEMHYGWESELAISKKFSAGGELGMHF